MASRSGEWKRAWVEPICGARCHGGGVCCITRYLKSQPTRRRRMELQRIVRRDGRSLSRYAHLIK